MAANTETGNDRGLNNVGWGGFIVSSVSQVCPSFLFHILTQEHSGFHGCMMAIAAFPIPSIVRGEDMNRVY